MGILRDVSLQISVETGAPNYQKHLKGVLKNCKNSCGCCGGAVILIVTGFILLHRRGFNSQFETMFQSVWQVIADLWQREDKINGCFKNSTSLVFQQCQNQMLFERKDSTVVFKNFSSFRKG